MKYVDIDQDIVDYHNIVGYKGTNPYGLNIVLNDELTDKPDKTLLQLAILLEKYGCRNLDELDGFIESCINRASYEGRKQQIGKSDTLNTCFSGRQ